MKSAKKSKTSRQPAHVAQPEAPAGFKLPAAMQAALEPVRTDDPCGPSLEYAPEYAMLQAKLVPKAEVQYGKFTNRGEAPDWLEVEQECLRLLSRGKDIVLLVALTRAATRLRGAAGLCEGLNLLRELLHRYPGEIHPRLEQDGESDPAVRANALAALADPEGLLGDIREIVIVHNTAFRLTVRDVERALGVPLSAQALSAEPVKYQLAELRVNGQPELRALADSRECFQRISEWSATTLADHAPDLAAPQRLLDMLAKGAPKAAAIPEIGIADSEPQYVGEESQTLATSASPMVTETAVEIEVKNAADNMAADGSLSASAPTGSWQAAAKKISGFNAAHHAGQREEVRELIRQLHLWVETYEPSSPVSLLLKQAGRLLGKRYAEVAQVIPADLLQLWDQ